jgi:hypothetical protein
VGLGANIQDAIFHNMCVQGLISAPISINSMASDYEVSIKDTLND